MNGSTNAASLAAIAFCSIKRIKYAICKCIRIINIKDKCYEISQGLY